MIALSEKDKNEDSNEESNRTETNLHTNLLKKIKKESLSLAYLLVILIFLFKIIFYNEEFIVSSRIAFMLWWMFVLPGFSLFWYWHERIGFIERLVIGTIIGLAVFGTLGYNLSILGLDLKYHMFFIPAIELIIAGIIVWKIK